MHVYNSDFTKSDFRYFEKARFAAHESNYHSEHVGCVAVYQGNVIGSACNNNKTHPMQKRYNQFRGIYSDCAKFAPTLHAEINCIKQIHNLNIKFSKVKLYIYRTCKDRESGMVRPCATCMEAIKDLGIRDIYYTTDDGIAYEKLVPRKY